MHLPKHQLAMTVLMTPDMANFSGNVHGGTILKLLDQVAYACASRYASQYVVTLSVDQVMFRQPIHVGELVTFPPRSITPATPRWKSASRYWPKAFATRSSAMPTAASSPWLRSTTMAKPPGPPLNPRPRTKSAATRAAQLRRELRKEFETRQNNYTPDQLQAPDSKGAKQNPRGSAGFG